MARVAKARAGASRGCKLLGGELAERVEEAEAMLTAERRHRAREDEGLVAERLEHVGYRQRTGRVAEIDHRLGGREVEAAAEDRALREASALEPAQEVPRPGDRRAEGARW